MEINFPNELGNWKHGLFNIPQILNTIWQPFEETKRHKNTAAIDSTRRETFIIMYLIQYKTREFSFFGRPSIRQARATPPEFWNRVDWRLLVQD